MNNVPEQITAGVTFDLLVTLTGYPATDWTATLHLRGAQAHDIAADAEGNQHRFSVSATETGGWTPGRYSYVLQVTDGDDVCEVERGQLEVLPDLVSQTAGYDGRTQAQIALEAINAVLANRATKDQESYRINNRELRRTTISDLIKLKSFYQAEVRRELTKGKGGNSLLGRKVLIRMR